MIASMETHLTISDQPALGFVGAGKAGTTLALAFSAAGYPVTAVYSRTASHAERVAHETGATICTSPADAARFSEVLFLTVPDDAVVSVTHNIAQAGGFRSGAAVVHCSGALPLDVLNEAADRETLTGFFHPLQVLLGASSIRQLRGAAVGIDGGLDLLPVLRTMATDLGATPVDVRDDARVPYHIAAVLAANYPFVLLAAASDLMQAAGISEECSLSSLLTLARGSLSSIEALGPRAGLTGPIVRGDAATVARHKQYLREHQPALLEVYRALGLLVLESAGDSFARGRVREELER